MNSHDTAQDCQRSGDAGFTAAGWTPRIVVSLISMCLLLDLLAVAYLLMAIALPSISASYQTTQVAWLPTAFMLVGAVTAPLIGKLADTHGKRKLLIACIALAAIGSIIAANAPTFGVLVVGCTLVGMLNPCVFLAYTLIPDTFPKSTVSMSVSILMSGMGLAAIPAPFLAGWLIESFGFTSVFWFLFICLAVCAPFIWFTTTESGSRQRSRLDWLGAVLLGTGIAGVLVGISFAPQWGWAAPRTLAFFFGGVVLLGAWVVSARRTKEPLLDLGLLKNRAVALIAVTTGLTFAAGAVYVVVLPYMAMTSGSLGLGYGFGVDAAGYAIIQAPFGAASLLGGVIVGWAVKYTGPRITMATGLAIVAVGLALTILWHGSEAMVIVFAVIVGLGNGCAYASGPNLIIKFVPQAIHATVGAITEVTRSILPAVLPVIAFTVLNSHIAKKVDGHVFYSNAGISLGLLVGVVGAVLGIAAALALPRRASHAQLHDLAAKVGGVASSPVSGG